MTDDSVIHVAAKRLYFDHSTDRIAETAPEIMALCEQFAKIAFAVFEKAHASTSDAAEREEISRIIDGHIDVPVSSRLAIARSLQGNGFRRSEPLGTLADPLGTILDAADRVAEWVDRLDGAGAMSLQADDLRRLVDHARLPQGEPSDAQVLAALNAWNVINPGESLSDYAYSNVSHMRAALRAAGLVKP